MANGAGLKILSLVVQGFESLPPHSILKVLAKAPLPSDPSFFMKLQRSELYNKPA